MSLRQVLARSATASRCLVRNNIRAGSTATPAPVKVSENAGDVASASPVGEDYHFVHIDDSHHMKEEKLSHIAAKLLGTALVLSLGYVGYEEYQHMTSGHHFHPPPYRYLKIRTASYPWPNDDCNLFDYDCNRLATLA